METNKITKAIILFIITFAITSLAMTQVITMGRYILNILYPCLGLDCLGHAIFLMFALPVPSVIIPLIISYFIFKKLGYNQSTAFIALFSYAAIVIELLLFLTHA